MPNCNISLPSQYVEKLLAEKKKTGKAIAEIIRTALDLYFKEAA